MNIKTLAAVLLSLSAIQAQATVIDFNQVSRSINTSYGNGNPYQEDGFQITNSSGNSGAMLFWGASSFNADPNGNTYSHNYGSSTSTLTKIGGGSFTFNTIDLTDVYNYGSGGNVQFNFVFADTSTSQSVVSLVTAPGLHTFTFDQSNVTAVSWTPLTTQGPWIQVDNIVVNGNTTRVPEPTTLALMGAGVAALVRARRKAA